MLDCVTVEEERMAKHSFRLPDASPPQPGWWLASSVAHAVLVVVLAGTVGTSAIITRTVGPLYVHIAPQNRFLPGIPAPQPEELDPEQPQALHARPVATDSATTVARPSLFAPSVVPIGPPPRKLASFDPVLGHEARVGATGYGTGRLWVGPVEAELGTVVPPEDSSTHAARVDSAVREIMDAIFATIPADSFAAPANHPWSHEIISWIRTIISPALPHEAAERQRIRAQFTEGIRQQRTNADIRRYVKEIRERKDRERRLRGRSVRRDTIP